MNSRERLNKISALTPIKNYLEIGVQRGVTFNGLNFEYKVAVDKKFIDIDIDAYETDKIRFHEVKSDEYFLRLHENAVFDLIFLDGMHEFRQTLRDFINATQHSHKRTIFVIDDTYPSDVFSTLLEKPFFHRRMHNSNDTSGAWHGDVYKVIFAIHDFFPKINYVTIDRGFGNPQTFLFWDSRCEFAPKFKSLEAIERSSYFDLVDNIELLNLKTEEEAFDMLKLFLDSNNVEKTDTRF